MDNAFEYVIILFFIFSILQSILGKKKKEQKNAENSSGAEVPRPQRRNTQTLEDLFGINLPKTPDYESDIKYEFPEKKPSVTWDPASEFRDIHGTLPKPIPDIDFDKPQSKSFVEQKRTEMAQINYEQIKVTNKLADSIRSKLKNPQSIREIILISEILNKPRALRR